MTRSNDNEASSDDALEQQDAPAPEFRELESTEAAEPVEATEPATKAAVPGSLAASTWVALLAGLLLLILLLVFILQNQQQVEVNLFAWSWQFPAGIAYLFSAIAGALITALVGGWRMFELRRQVRRANPKN